MNILKFSKSISLVTFGGIGLYTLYKNQKIARDLFLPENHPTREQAEMLIKLDKRITNFCGYNYKVDGYKIIENSEKYQSYRMNINGIRGLCKVLVKVQKLNLEELEFLNQQQEKISKMPLDFRKKEPFVPIDFNDVFIPTEETLKGIRLRLENIRRDFLQENKENFTNNQIPNALTENDFDFSYIINQNTKENFNQNKIDIFRKIKNLPDSLNKEKLQSEISEALNLRKSDTFYRFMNISVSFSDDVVFNIRPLSVKFRNYELIETKFSEKNFLDIYNKINKIQNDYYKKIKYELSAEEAREEIKISKENQMREKINNRRKFFQFQFVFFFAIVFGFRHYINNVKYESIVKGISQNLSKNKFLKKEFEDNFIIPYVSFRYNLFKKNFSFRCICQYGDKRIIVKGKSLPNANNVLPVLEFFDRENKLIKV